MKSQISPRLLRFLIAVACLIFLSLCLHTWPAKTSAAPGTDQPAADSPSPTPTPTPDPRLEELEKRLKELETQAKIAAKEKEIAEAEASRATADKNRILNLLPTPTATPLAGTDTTTGTVTFESELLAYRALGTTAKTIADDLTGITGSVVIHNHADIKAMESYVIVLNQIKTLTRRYAQLNPPTGGEESLAAFLAAPQIASTLIRSVADIFALFRTNTTTAGAGITPDDKIIFAAVAEALRGKGLQVYEPDLYLPKLLDEQPSTFITELANLDQAKTRAERLIAEFEALPAEAQKTHARRTIIPKLRALNSQVDTFMNNLAQVDSTTKVSPLMAYNRAEKLKTLIAPAGHVLYLKFAKGEGTRVTKTGLFSGTKVTHAGGIILSYTLFNKDGLIVHSGVRGAYHGGSNNKGQQEVVKLP